MHDKPALLLLPNLIGEHRHSELFLPASVAKALLTIDGLIAESDKEGRRYLSRFETKKSTLETPIALFNEHTPDNQLDFLLEPIASGQRWGLISDAGLPCIADPGSKLVLRARQRGMHVQAFVGPSAIFLALMLSGLPSQKFFFHGYLHKEPNKRKEDIQRLVAQARSEQATQLFMETPYRNQYTLTTLIETLGENTLLSVCWDITMPTQGVLTLPIAQWRKATLPNLEKKPAVFLFCI